MAAKSTKKGNKIPEGATVVATNRQARRDYEILETFECGLVLKGSEVKSLREAKVQLAEAYATVYQNEAWIHSLHIVQYSHSAAAMGHEPGRTKKLLMHRREIDRLGMRLDAERLTLVPLSVYFLEGRAKVELALARGKKQQDRRQDIAKRDADREARRELSRNISGKNRQSRSA